MLTHLIAKYGIPDPPRVRDPDWMDLRKGIPAGRAEHNRLRVQSLTVKANLRVHVTKTVMHALIA